MTAAPTAASAAAKASGLVLLTLASGQFVMALDSSVMNVAIATVAKDVGTDVTGIQTAITLYTLVMASFMITGGKIGEIIGRKRAFTIGCVIYACGSLTTALSQSLTVLIVGWSFLEGFGAALIMPAIVALVASNFGTVGAAARVRARRGRRRDRRCGRAADRRPVHDLRLLAVGVRRRGADRAGDPRCSPAGWTTRRPRRAPSSTSSAPRCRRSGLGLIVFGILRSGAWGFVQPKPGAPEWLGLSPVIWLVLGGGVVLALFVMWENRRIARGEGALLDPTMLRNIQLRERRSRRSSSSSSCRPGLFFVVPLFLSVALGLSAIATGVRLLPLSITLLLAAAGIPKLLPERVAAPGRPRSASSRCSPGSWCWSPLLDAGARAGDRHLAAAARRSRHRRDGLAARERHRVGGARRAERRGRRTPEHGAPTSARRSAPRWPAPCSSPPSRASFLTGIQNNPAVPDRVAARRRPSSPSGVPFISDADLKAALDGRARAARDGRRDRRRRTSRAGSTGCASAVAVLALFALVALLFTGGIPTIQPGAQTKPSSAPT